ncbi:MAG: tetratricopeptide repeat protein, partial [Fimbriiglobus sp.]
MGADADRGVSVRARLGIAVVLFAGTFALYAKTVPYPFSTLDDPHYVFQNPPVARGLSFHGVVWAWTTSREANWHPLTWMSLQLDATLSGGVTSPAVFRGHNILLHAASAALLYLVLLGMTDRVGRSLAVAALWAAHPQHVESVVWITERKDVLSGMFGMLALLAYTWHARQPSARRLAVVAVLLGLGLLAKPMLVTLPFALLLLDFWPLGRTPWAAAVVPGRFPQRDVLELVREKLPLLGVVVASSVVTFLVQQKGGAMEYPLPLGSRVANAVLSYWAYLRQSVAPTDLALFYPHLEPSLASVAVVAGLLAIVGMMWAAWAARRRAPYLLVGWFWFLGTMVPMIGLVQVGNQARADRYTYLPHVGLFVAVVWAAADGLARVSGGRRVVGAVAGIGVVAAAAAMTEKQTWHWRSSLALWEHTAAQGNEGNPRIRENLGTALLQLQRHQEAEPHLRFAMKCGYDYPRIGLAVIESDRGNIDAGIEILQPFFDRGRDFGPAYHFMSTLLLRSGRATEAIPYLKAIGASPEILGYAETVAAGREKLAAQDVPAARALFEKAESIPGYGEPRFLLALCAESEGDYAGAVKLLRESVAINPNLPPARARLGILLHHLGQKDGAVAECRKAVELRPKA